MIEQAFSRTAMLIGQDGIDKLQNASVAIFGVGGVGGYTVEALARSGVGTFHLIDNDTVSESNLNRQIIATRKTIGRLKVEVAKERILDINPHATVYTYPTFFLPENADDFDFSSYDYVVDAIDTVTGKLEIIVRATEANVPVISAMGAGNKMDPTAFVVTDIYKTSVCPLAKVMRRELKKRGIKKLKVVYSTEVAMKPMNLEAENNSQCDAPVSVETTAAPAPGRKKATPGSMSFIPGVAGLILAGEVIKDLL